MNIFDDEEPMPPNEEVLKDISFAKGTWRATFMAQKDWGFPRLSWEFIANFENIRFEDGTTAPVNLSVDQIVLPYLHWQDMAGQIVECQEFAEPCESSVYYFDHYRYDVVQLKVLEQQGTRVLVSIDIKGDIDELDVPSWTLTEWFDFEGIYVIADEDQTLSVIDNLLRESTNTQGLSGSQGHPSFVFVPKTNLNK